MDIIRVSNKPADCRASAPKVNSYLLHRDADSAREYTGQFACECADSGIPALRGAMDTLDREPAIVGVWCEFGGGEWYVTRNTRAAR